MYFKGYGYTSFALDGFQQGSGRGALGECRAQTGSTWIALTFFEFQSNAASADIAPSAPARDRIPHATSSAEDLRTAVNDARRHGMKIMLKPHVDCYSGVWRASITPDPEGKWFEAYESMIMKYALLAEAEHIEMLCVGTELVSATIPQHANRWKALIARIRMVYAGWLTYSSNWSGVQSAEAEYEQIGFWDALDFIGVSAYFPLAEKPSLALPHQAEAEARIHTHGMRLSAAAVRWKKRVILTEAGCQSARGALADPADHTLGASAAAAIDNAAQAVYYASILTYFGNRPWCAGIFWWNWETVPGAQQATDYTCCNKPASRILKAFYEDGVPPSFLA